MLDCFGLLSLASLLCWFNADLPIVGGSILSHDHYQAGRHEFPMAKAPIEKLIKLADYPQVIAGVVKWPMSVIRLQSTDKELLN